jgi:hypothetical protein
MAAKHKMLDIDEVRKRAAQIRRNWSPTEKLRRTGLPPDMPPKLRQFFLGTPQHAWCVAAEGPRRSATPHR